MLQMDGHLKEDSSGDESIEMYANNIDTFPIKLHKMLEAAEKEGLEHIISWNPDGRSFTVHQQKVFAQTIMQQHFNQTQYKSFQRQLNLYNFERLLRGKGKALYSHHYFVKGDRSLCRFIRRERNTALGKDFFALRPIQAILAETKPPALVPGVSLPLDFGGPKSGGAILHVPPAAGHLLPATKQSAITVADHQHHQTDKHAPLLLAPVPGVLRNQQFESLDSTFGMPPPPAPEPITSHQEDDEQTVGSIDLYTTDAMQELGADMLSLSDELFG